MQSFDNFMRGLAPPPPGCPMVVIWDMFFTWETLCVYITLWRMVSSLLQTFCRIRSNKSMGSLPSGSSLWTSKLVAQMVKNLCAMQETWIQSLGQEDPLEKGMATHSCILAWRIRWTEELGGLQSMGLKRVGHDWTQRTRKPSLALLMLPGITLIASPTGTEPAGIFGRNPMIKTMSFHVTPWKKKRADMSYNMCVFFF